MLRKDGKAPTQPKEANRGTAGAPGDFVVEGRLIEDGSTVRVTVRDGVVANIAHPDGVFGTALIAAGWIDLQVNGFNGHDPNAADAGAEAVSAMVRALWRHGVTAICSTITTESESHISRALGAIAQACDSDPLVAASVVGIHVEGPHISREDGPRGAHPVEHVRPPDIEEYHRWQVVAGGRIRIITLSPEYDEAIPYIREIVRDGVVASIGHTCATGDQIRAAVEAGARWSTHLGNGAHALIPRHPNYVWDQLAEDRLSAGFIFDGHHLPPAVMRTVIRAKGVERSILVSDASAVAGLPPGIYRSSRGVAVELLSSGRLELQGTPSPYLAGSATTLPVCLANAVRHADVTLPEAIRMVTANPSRLLNLPTMGGRESVRVGAAANLTVFRQAPDTLDVEVLRTIVAGREVYSTQRA